MKCKCGSENRDEAQFCRRCGAELMSKKSVIQEDNIICREEIIQNLKGVINTLITDKRREEAGYTPDMQNKLLLFLGETGSGKSTIANWFVNELKNEKIITEQPGIFDVKLLKQNYADEFLLSNFLYQSTSKLLIIDNIHDDMDYAGELFRAVSSNKLGLIVVCIGLNEPVEEYLNKTPDIKQKIYGTPFFFSNYDISELKRILEKKIFEKGYSFSVNVDDDLLLQFIKECNDNKKKEHINGWLIEKEVWPEINKAFATRVIKEKNSDLKNILPEDIHIKNKKRTEEEIFAELNKLIGMNSAKAQIREIYNSIKLAFERKKKGLPYEMPKIHIFLTGNPGTGKTTVARILGKLFYAMGLLPSDEVIERNGLDLTAGYVGQTKDKVNELCDNAMGHVLFIDEAYYLGDSQGNTNSFNNEAIGTLLKRMEDDRGKFIVVAAGYKNEMQNFLQMNPGLKSRFTDYINIDDYTTEELFEIFKFKTSNIERILTEDAAKRVFMLIKKINETKPKDFANARTIRNLLKKVKTAADSRINMIPPEKRTKDVLQTIEAVDIPETFKEAA